MFDLIRGTTSDCTGLSRRSFLRVGGLSALGLTVPQFLKLRAETAALPGGRDPKTTRCIFLWMQGGPSHHDMFDPKPDAPAEIRGEFGTIPTTLPGVRFAEHLPKLARLTDLYAVVRGHDPKNGSHGTADHNQMTGMKFNASLAYPCHGAVVAKERGFANGIFPFVQVNRYIDRRFNGGVAGYLGDQYNAFEIPDDPSSPSFRVRDLSVADPEQAKMARRFSMLAEMDRYQKQIERSASPVVARDTFYEKAHGIITSPAAKRAFDLAQESDKLRDAYGRNSLGQGCLLARRLIEAGVQFVTVTDGGWDTHANNFKTLKDRNLPRFDAAFSTLLTDLNERGLLDSTLVVWTGDFGRTPKINPSAGRDHWASAGQICFAGGGIRPGQVVGATNSLGEFVIDTPVTPADMAATIYTLMGINPHTWYKTADGRPIELVPEGKPVRQLIG